MSETLLSWIRSGLARTLAGLIILLCFELALDVFAALGQNHMETVVSHLDAESEDGRVLFSSSDLNGLQDAGELAIRIDEADVIVDYELTLDADSPLVGRVIRGSGSAGGALVTALVGQVAVNGVGLEFEAPKVDYDSAGETAEISSMALFDRREVGRVDIEVDGSLAFLDEKKRTVQLRAADLRIETRAGPLPDSQHESGATWALDAAESLEIRAESFTGQAEASRSSLRTTLVDVAERFERHVGPVITGTLGALPFLFLILYVRLRRSRGLIAPDDPDVSKAMEAIQLFIGPYLALYGFLVAVDFIYFLGQRFPLEVPWRGERYYGHFGGAVTPILVTLGMVAWPTWVRSHDRDAARTRQRAAWEWIAPSGVLAAPFIMLAYADAHPTSLSLPSLSSTAAGMAVVNVSCLLMTWRLARMFLRGGVLVACWVTGVATNLALLEQSAYGEGWLGRLLSALILGLVSFVVVYWFVRAASVALPAVGALISSRARSMLTILGVLVMAFPYQALTDEVGGWGGAFSATFSVVALAQVALVLVVVMLVWTKPSLGERSDLESVSTDRYLGIVLVAATLLAPTHTVLFIPLKLLVGVPMFLWLFRIESAQMYRKITSATPNKRKVAEELVALVRRQRRLEELETEGLQKLGGAGAASITRARKKLAVEVGSRKKALGLEESQDARVLWSVGPDVTRLERAKTGAKLSLLFAIPWICLFIGGYLDQQFFEFEFILLIPLQSFATAVLTWTMYGFVFGYYYEFIRGDSGLTKAFNFSLALIVPTLTLTAGSVLFEASSWSGGIMFALQIFIQSMLLGLSMDLRMLQRADMGWRQLVEIHRLGGIAAWGTSVLVAIAAAIATALSSSIVDVLSEALGQLDPSGGASAPSPPPVESGSPSP